MVTRVNPPSPSQQVVDDNGDMQQEFQSWTQIITNQSLIIGTGSPEGVIEAEQGARYLDDAGAPGATQYVKQKGDILGDKTKGWSL